MSDGNFHQLWDAAGEDNEYVLKELLGYTDDEIAELLIDKAITTDADLPPEGSL